MLEAGKGSLARSGKEADHEVTLAANRALDAVGIPFTALALATVALIDKATSVLMTLSPATWQKLVLEGSCRPELAGMVIWQAVISLILLLVGAILSGRLSPPSRPGSGKAVSSDRGRMPDLCRFAMPHPARSSVRIEPSPVGAQGSSTESRRRPRLAAEEIHPSRSGSGTLGSSSKPCQESDVRRVPPPIADWTITPRTKRPTSTSRCAVDDRSSASAMSRAPASDDSPISAQFEDRPEQNRPHDPARQECQPSPPSALPDSAASPGSAPGTHRPGSPPARSPIAGRIAPPARPPHRPPPQ